MCFGKPPRWTRKGTVKWKLFFFFPFLLYLLTSSHLSFRGKVGGSPRRYYTLNAQKRSQLHFTSRHTRTSYAAKDEGGKKEGEKTTTTEKYNIRLSFYLLFFFWIHWNVRAQASTRSGFHLEKRKTSVIQTGNMVKNGVAYGISCGVYVGAVGLFIGFCFLFPKIADRFCRPRDPENGGEQYKVYGTELWQTSEYTRVERIQFRRYYRAQLCFTAANCKKKKETPWLFFLSIAFSCIGLMWSRSESSLTRFGSFVFPFSLSFFFFWWRLFADK